MACPPPRPVGAQWFVVYAADQANRRSLPACTQRSAAAMVAKVEHKPTVTAD